MIETEISKWVFDEKYRFENENEEGFGDRIGKALGKTKEDIALFSNVIKNHKFMLAGRSLYGLGTGKKNICFSNCFVIPIKNDSMRGIMKAAENAAMTFKYGGGVGYNFSILRPQKSKVFTSGGSSTGVVSFMHIFDAVCETIMTGGNRRGAGIGVLGVFHPDIENFITAKRNGGLKSFNLSVGITDSFMKAVDNNEDWDLIFPDTTHEKYDSEWDGDIEGWKAKNYPIRIFKTVKARDLYDTIIKSNYAYAEPGMLFLDTINNMNNLSYCEKIQSTNPCFAKYMYITTKNGLFKIESLVGKNVEIYNGTEWETIDNFQITGTNQELVRVWLYDGSYLDVTPYHGFYLEDGTKLETKDLKIGDRLKYENNLIVEKGISAKGSYLKGFMLSDGCLKREKEPLLIVYEPKFCCKDRLIQSASELDVKNVNTNAITELGFRYDGEKNIETMQGLAPRENGELYKWCSDEYKTQIPEEVFQWDLKSKCEFIAGVMDGDGNIIDGKNGFSYQFSSVHYDFLVDFLRLLKSIGVFGKISLMKEAQYKEIKGKTYWTQDCWRLTIPQKYAIELSKKVKFERLFSFENRTIKYKTKFNYSTVVDIESLDGLHTVYCCKTSNSHIMTGEAVVTAQCGELPLSDYGACLLGSINLATHVLNPFESPKFDFDALRETVSTAVRMLNRVLDINIYPLKEQNAEATEKRLIGLGITGLGDTFAMMKMAYSSAEAATLTEKIMKLIRDESYIASIELAKVEGAFPKFDKEKFCSGKFVKSLPKDIKDAIKEHGIRNGRIISIAPTGTISLLMNNVSSGLEPIFSLEYNRTARDDSGELAKNFLVEDYAWRLYKNMYNVSNTNQAPPYFETALELDVSDHSRIQTIIQKYVDSSVSKTINIPETYPFEDFKNVYWNAWKSGLKGCTTYRPNDITGSILSVKPSETDLKVESNLDAAIRLLKECDEFELDSVFKQFPMHYKEYDPNNDHPYEKELLDVEPSRRHRVEWRNGEKVYVIVTYDEASGYPVEIFTNMPKEAGINGSGKFDKNLYLEKKSNWTAITRLCSSLFRIGAPLSEIIKQLDRSSFSEYDVSGLIATVLRKYPYDSDCEDIEDEEFFIQITAVCPKCGQKTLQKHAQCEECTNCDYGKCSM